MIDTTKWNIDYIGEKVIKPMYEDGTFPLPLADEIKDAIEKQIPKKPRWKTDYENYASYHVCPTCGAMVLTNHNYCAGHRLYGEETEKGCGQLLDWSDKDE